MIAADMLGPVHLNIQFRENLAPEAGPVRGDKRVDAMTSFSTSRFIDVPSFNRWSLHGKKWTSSYSNQQICDSAYLDIANLISQSKRGIIVLGNMKSMDAAGGFSDSGKLSAVIDEFATFTGFPVFAGAQSADIRFRSRAVVPYVGKHAHD